MIEQYYPLFIMVSIICASIGGIIATRNITRTAPISNKIKRQYDLYISDLEATNKRLNGKVNQMKKGITISPDEAGDPFSAISGILDQIAPQLPASIRPLLKNKKAVDFISNYVQQNPDAVKSIVEKFTSKSTGKASTATTTEDQSTL
tara:strand:+ start:956 stop:1399 length:444 start_codon:yes stop_codon:yes gene_type:complete